MKTRSWLALALRESRGSAGRLVFFVACLSVGVAAVVAVAGLSQALDDGIQAQARQLLAADLADDRLATMLDEGTGEQRQINFTGLEPVDFDVTSGTFTFNPQDEPQATWDLQSVTHNTTNDYDFDLD